MGARYGGALSAMAVTNAMLGGSILVAAGIYQLTPMKQACLRRCRGPVQFLTERWQPGAAGAFRMGLAHGLYCLGCCWFLMALLFFGGIGERFVHRGSGDLCFVREDGAGRSLAARAVASAPSRRGSARACRRVIRMWSEKTMATDWYIEATTFGDCTATIIAPANSSCALPTDTVAASKLAGSNAAISARSSSTAFIMRSPIRGPARSSKETGPCRPSSTSALMTSSARR